MAITVTVLQRPVSIGDRYNAIAKIAADTSYTTGGYPFKPSDIGFATAANTDPELKVEIDNSLGYGTKYDYTNNKILFYSTAGTEVTAATNLTAINDLRVEVRSKYRG